MTPAPFANAPSPGSKVVVGLSGGVDSAVAALLLCQAGYDVQPMFMKNWDEDDDSGQCSATEDLADARAVCEVLRLELATVNLSFEYWEKVFVHFLEEYGAGRTPNPDILCNQEIKFRAFLGHAKRFGAARIATGHYAGLDWSVDHWRLLRSPDDNKDQTYFLHTLNQKQLKTALFPLYGLSKSEVRTLAAEHGLPVHEKPDSTGICFIGERSMRDLLGRYLNFEPGDIVNDTGEVIGQHAGLPVYTIGQRKGLQVGGRRNSDGRPWYVTGKCMNKNRLYVVQGNDHPALFSREVLCGPGTWVQGRAPVPPVRCKAQLRHRQAPQTCRIDVHENRLRVSFDQAQRAIAPGQSIVFYAGDECLGGAVIEARV